MLMSSVKASSSLLPVQAATNTREHASRRPMVPPKVFRTPGWPGAKIIRIYPQLPSTATWAHHPAGLTVGGVVLRGSAAHQRSGGAMLDKARLGKRYVCYV